MAKRIVDFASFPGPSTQPPLDGGRHFSIRKKGPPNYYDARPTPPSPTYKNNKASFLRRKTMNSRPDGLAGAPGYGPRGAQQQAGLANSKRISVSTGELGKTVGGLRVFKPFFVQKMRNLDSIYF